MISTGAAALLDADPATLSHAARLDLLIRLQALRDRVDALEWATLAALAAGDPTEKQWVREEVAVVLTLAPSTATGRLQDAAHLAELLPATARRVSAGDLSVRYARVLLDLTRALPDAVRSTVEAAVLPKASGRTVAEFRRSVRRAIAAHDPRGVDERHASAVLERRVCLTDCEYGMSELYAYLPADGAHRLMARVAGLARKSNPADERTGDQRRADALVGLGEGVDGTGGGPRVQIDVTVPLASLQTDDVVADGVTLSAASVDEPATDASISAAVVGGELAGYGPIPASMVRRLAMDPTVTWRRIVTDTTGAPIDTARTYQPRSVRLQSSLRRLLTDPVCPAPARPDTYRPGAALQALVVARDRTCRFPGCSRPARSAELDHITAWADGGRTVARNLHALCSRHHRLKHEAGWTAHRRPDGATVWRSPNGRIRAKPPDDTIETYCRDRSVPPQRPAQEISDD